jgi:hypothetical protein
MGSGARCLVTACARTCASCCPSTHPHPTRPPLPTQLTPIGVQNMGLGPFVTLLSALAFSSVLLAIVIAVGRVRRGGNPGEAAAAAALGVAPAAKAAASEPMGSHAGSTAAAAVQQQAPPGGSEAV